MSRDVCKLSLNAKPRVVGRRLWYRRADRTAVECVWYAHAVPKSVNHGVVRRLSVAVVQSAIRQVGTAERYYARVLRTHHDATATASFGALGTRSTLSVAAISRANELTTLEIRVQITCAGIPRTGGLSIYAAGTAGVMVRSGADISAGTPIGAARLPSSTA